MNHHQSQLQLRVKGHDRRLGQHRVRVIALGVAAIVALVTAAPGFGAEAGKLNGTVNVNTATADELQLLPGIGESRANAVIVMRKKRGGFKSVDELSNVKGIGERALAKLRPYARTEGKTTARRE